MTTTDYQAAVRPHSNIARAVPRTRAIGRRLAALTSLAFALAGMLFVLYPAVRPFSDEVSLDGARAFASGSWVAAHAIAMAGFILLGLGLLGTNELLRGTRGSRPAAWGLVLSWIGIGMTLPYYGAEVFGLHAVGQAAVDRQDVGLMSVVDDIRWEAGIWFILCGLVLLAAGTILVAVAMWRADTIGRWGGVLLAVSFALYIPQFAGPQPVRVAHGVLVLVACWLIARGILRRASGMDAPAARDRVPTAAAQNGVIR
jgi:hypothetical protein